MEDSQSIGAAIVALVGTLIGTYFAYIKWKDKRRNEIYGEYIKKQQHIYSELWDLLENFSILLRIEEFSNEKVKIHVRGICIYVMKNDLYIDPEINRLARDYVASLLELNKAVRESENEKAKFEYESTCLFPHTTIEKVMRLGHLQKKSITIRDKIISKITYVIAGQVRNKGDKI
jgi:hypothetical protein